MGEKLNRTKSLERRQKLEKDIQLIRYNRKINEYSRYQGCLCDREVFTYAKYKDGDGGD
jgi:hypothetical protein